MRGLLILLLALPSPALAERCEVERYLEAIRDPARERRYALIEADLQALRDEIEGLVRKFEAKRAANEEWLARREAFIDRARDGLVAIYARMRADAAAKRMTLVDPNLAAALLMKMKPAQAGQVLNEMDGETAARLSTLIGMAGEATR